MREIRCLSCKKLLGIVPQHSEFEIEIKCPKCKIVYTYKAEAQEAQG